MARDLRIWTLTGDLGYGMLDFIRRDYPDRFLNCGASEQAMVGIAVGMAHEGIKPFVYSITPFLLYRPFEVIRNYINHESVPVRLVGSGYKHDYAHDGFSHHPDEQEEVLRLWPNITSVFPQTKEELPDLVARVVDENKPWYINLRR